MLYIDPSECIDCAACVPACPVDAIFAEADLPGKWSKFTQINADFFASGAGAVAAPAAGGGKSAPPAKKKEPEPVPLVALELNPEEIYQTLADLRGDLAEQRQMSDADLRARKSPALVGLAAAAVVIFAFAIWNNISKVTNFSLYARIGALAIAGKKPDLSGSEYTINRRFGGKEYRVKVSDSIFGARTLTLQVPTKPFGENIYHQDEKFFAANQNENSRFFYVFVDRKSNGTLDSALKVREFWSKGNTFLGRYQKPLSPTDELQKIYRTEAQKLGKKLGL
jgi:ferredoxin